MPEASTKKCSSGVPSWISIEPAGCCSQREARTASQSSTSLKRLKNERRRDALNFSASERSCERSEERRVGKECRSRWSQYHEKNKKKRRKIVQQMMCKQ